jgi:hypothetical protein
MQYISLSLYHIPEFDREMLTKSGTYPWSFVIQIFHSSQPSHGGDRTIFEMKTLTLLRGTLASVASLLAATLRKTKRSCPDPFVSRSAI